MCALLGLLDGLKPRNIILSLSGGWRSESKCHSTVTLLEFPGGFFLPHPAPGVASNPWVVATSSHPLPPSSHSPACVSASLILFFLQGYQPMDQGHPKDLI